jgi:hypothetical protein
MVWFDEDTIPPGKSIPLAVEEGIESSRTMILCLSTAFLENEWPRAERAAMQFADPANHDHTVLPVMFARCKLPKFLAHLKYIDYQRHSERTVDSIVASIPDVADERPPPSPTKVAQLLAEAKGAERRRRYEEILTYTTEALDLAEQADAEEPESAVELARARKAHSFALLGVGRDLEHAWELAAAAADPATLAAYPEDLFDAFAAKAEAATSTGRIAIAEGAIDAAEPLASEIAQTRRISQIRGRIALQTHQPAEAIRHYEEARRSFAASIHTGSDEQRRWNAKFGAASCLTNTGIANRSLGRLVDARALLAEAAEIYAELDTAVDEAVARRLMAACHFDDREWQQGQKELDHAEQLARSECHDATLLDCLELRARVMATLENLAGAQDLLRQALDAAKNQPPDRRRRLHQMLATIARSLNDRAAARRHLDVARVLAEGDEAALLDVEHQLEELESDRTAPGPGAAPDRVIEQLSNDIVRATAGAERANLMRRLASAHFSRPGEIGKAAEWYRRAHDEATSARNMKLVVDAQIGLAQVAFHRDLDNEADVHLRDAMAIAQHLPHWEARASIIGLQALVLARRGQMSDALQKLDEAHEIAFAYNLHEEIDWIDRQREDVRQWLSLRALPTIDLAALAVEVHRLEEWFPEERTELRRLWWYWRGEDVMQNIATGTQSGCLIVSDDKDEVADLHRELGVLFDTTVFVTETSFVRAQPVPGFVPIPEDLNFPFVNYVALSTDDMSEPPSAPA